MNDMKEQGWRNSKSLDLESGICSMNLESGIWKQEMSHSVTQCGEVGTGAQMQALLDSCKD